MPCPRCGSNYLWDDGIWWGCHVCPFFTSTIRNIISKLDRFMTHDEFRKVKK